MPVYPGARICFLAFLAETVYDTHPRFGAVHFGFHPNGPQRSPKRLSLPLTTGYCLCSKRFLGHLSIPCLVVDEFFFLPGGFFWRVGMVSSLAAIVGRDT